MGSSMDKDTDFSQFPVHLSGSRSDGQSTARYVANDPLKWEYDIIYVPHSIQIENENQIEYLAEAPGYIRIFANDNKQIPKGMINNQILINAYQLKEDIYSIMKKENVRPVQASSISIENSILYL
ncbi:unnamed protein product [Didymodactylos carnosus]|uniref:Uncharacterized protein n=1 Tax=Didymodactylos carnosus TaxID=1234261 RepID=A0A815GH88_9BILA|nr:unnamed protein product [Didymodactylos carnosus]CAF4197954.1 unnamed protein product [Didymodactylos carnosus]